MARGDADEGDNIIGPRLRALRDRLGLSQRALARKAGVPSSTVSLVESGRTSPSVGLLKRLLDAAGVSWASSSAPSSRPRPSTSIAMTN